VFSGYSRQERNDLPQTKDQKLADCDVFYVHWRSFSNVTDKENPEDIRTEIEMHASVFNNCCRIYSPVYRSASGINDADGINAAYDDVKKKKAFNHFITNWNASRPFILAGEGQGSYLLLKLIQQELINSNNNRVEDFRKRMVCAYLPGCPILPNDINTNSYFKPGKKPDDVKCIVSWSTHYGAEAGRVHPCHYFFPENSRPYEEGKSNEETKQGKYISLNPLTWDTTENCDAKENKGSLSVNEGVLYHKVCGASIIDGGACIRVNYDGKSIYDGDNPKERQSDYLPFWMSIRINAADRLRKWLTER